jgi:DNA-binding CsgD family transcriptional regulator
LRAARRVATLERSEMHRREALIASLDRADDIRGVFAAASGRLRGLIPHDAAIWMGADPATTLPTAPTRSENLVIDGGVDGCLDQWEREFLVEDVNLYGDLTRRPVPAGGLQLATRHRPARSARYRDFLRPHGFDDELRAVLRVDGAAWGLVGLYRERGRPPFEAAETDLLAGLSAPLAAAVRDHARRDAPAGGGALPGPGLMVFSPTGELTSYNDDALAWIEQLPDGGGEDRGDGVRLPIVVISTLMCARAVAARRERRPARARVRASGSGRWLVCHASCLRGADGRVGDTALVIEAAQAAEIAPIIVQAYELSPRERQITELIAQGAGTADIAARLHLSSHTVRDYVKAVFDKVGVSSRGELVAKLFAEHYAPLHLDPARHERS